MNLSSEPTSSRLPCLIEGRLIGLLLVGSVGHLAQLILLGKFAGQGAQILDQSLGGGNHSLAGCNLTISLDAQQEVGGQGVRNLVMQSQF